jgi:uncharacterized protein (TIGR03435 family)
VLAERFHLTYHMEDRPLPGYVMTVAKDGAKLAEAKDPAAAEQLPRMRRTRRIQGSESLTCTSETITQFLSRYGGMYFPQPVIDHTGLKKSYDFTLEFALSTGSISAPRMTIFAFYTDVHSSNSLALRSRSPGTYRSPSWSSIRWIAPRLRTSRTLQS